jgi:hypothetical protein
MNKSAKKRVKEAIRKEIAARSESRKEQGSSYPANPSKKLPVSRGFTPRPDKKRG